MASSGEAEEAAQEAALRSYKDQLTQVEMTLNFVETEEEKAPLRQLSDDLKELIQISEDALLQLKKDNLMKLINGDGDDDVTLSVVTSVSSSMPATTSAGTDIFDDSASSSPPPSTPISSSSSSPTDIEAIFAKYSPLLGTSCRAPFPSSPRSGLHNAIVHALEGVDDDGRLQVKVVYTHPQEPSMVTCQYFLNDRCLFDEGRCRQNHGVIVNADDLRDYVEPDFETGVSVGSLCLVKRDADAAGSSSRRSFPLWHPAEVLHVEEELVTVQIKSVNQTIAVPFADIFPFEDDADDDSDEDYDDDDEDATEASSTLKRVDEVEEEDVVREIRVATDLSEFGRWESTTRGIASKILAKWGYVIGEGLGKDGEGRVVPVEARIFPQGKSLDVCMAMRLKREGLGGDETLLLKKKKREKRKWKKGEEAAKKGYKRKTKEEECMSAFNFINSIKLTKKGGTIAVEEEDGEKDKCEINNDRRNKKITKGKSCKDLRVQLLQTEGEVAKVEREMEKVEETIVRNDKKNAPVAAQAREKKKELEKYRLTLKNSLKSIQGEQKNRSNKQKLSIF